MSFSGKRRVGIPCDTSIREILDGVDPNDLRPLFKDAFRQLQRGKVLEKFVFMQGCYLLNLDGTGYFSSDTLHSDACLEKVNKKTGKVTYYLQTVGAAVVHHDLKEVIVLPPETIRKQDGETKMDCERNAVRRFLGKLRQDHPHLQFIVNEDGLSSNGPHIEDLEENNLHYILGVKPGDHKFLFDYVDGALANGDLTELTITKQDKPHLTHCFRIVYDAPLNKSHQEKRVTFVEYWEENSKTGKTQHFTWITDLSITEDNVFHFMRGARARWKIESVPQAHRKEVRLWTDRLWQSYAEDEGRSLGVGFQEQASNHSKLLRLRAVGGERWGQSVEDVPRAGRKQRDERK